MGMEKIKINITEEDKLKVLRKVRREEGMEEGKPDLAEKVHKNKKKYQRKEKHKGRDLFD